MKRLITLHVAAIAAMCHAGIKYWDNPDYRAFDVDCYAPGAVWNLDGIRNAGAAHDASALVWKNLGSSGDANDVFLQKSTGASSWGTATAAELADGTYGEWTDDGFAFKGASRLRANSPKRIDTGTSYTMQFLVDATSAGQTAANAIVFNSNWQKLSFAVNKAGDSLIWRTAMSVAANDHVSIAGPSFGYATAIANGDANTTAFFDGTEIPSSGDGFRQYSAITAQSEAGYSFGSTGDASSLFKGTLKFFRYWQRTLSEEELVWNRVVDERRYFDRAAPLPVTNAVIATSVEGLCGAEPAGCYAVDGSGHTFTAPRTAVKNGTTYLCTGYTLERWDDTAGDWGAPVMQSGALAAPVSASDRVRIIWRWTDATGLVTYDIGDYVWKGLELFYDGICNQGRNVAHSTTATNWVNLGSAGAANDMFLQLLNAGRNGWTAAVSLDAVGDRDPGAWTDAGFALKGDSRFRVVNTGGSNGAINTGTGYTLQTLLDATAAAQNESSAFVFSLSADKYSFVLYKSGRLDWRSDSAQTSGNPLFMAGTSFDYATAIANGTDNTLAFFDGLEIPSSGDGFRQIESITPHGLERGYDLGGYGSANYDKLLVGTIKFFRQYDHALTPAEVSQNRAVDDFRYFGRPAVTNVIVQTTNPCLHGVEPEGPYQIADDSSHTFTAPATATILVNGREIVYACAGYTVETQDGLAWTVTDRGDGNAVAIAEGGVKRLTWLWKPVSGLRTAADYGFDDYSQAGLRWNYDGILNQGIDQPHSNGATTWKNLGSDANADLHWNGATSTGHWEDDGYAFAGGPRFKGNASFRQKNCTMQTLIDGNPVDQSATATDHAFAFNGSQNYFNFRVVKASFDGSAANSFCWVAQNNMYMYFHAPNNQYSFATAIQDFDNKKAMMFPGTEIPTEYVKDGTYGAQRLYHEFSSMSAVNDAGYGLGNLNTGTAGFVGIVKNFRYYDRVLTADELVRNRNADAVRYFGELGVTNVLVRTKYGDVAGEAEELAEAPGAYKVEGRWTFSAARVKGKTGTLTPVAGCYTEELVNGVWSNRVWHDGQTQYTYDAETANGKTIRLTWSVPPPGTAVVIR